MQMSDVLTLRDALTLGAIVSAATHNARVAWLDEKISDDILIGTARSIGDEHGAFLAQSEDVRDAWLRVTTDRGWEAFLPVRDVMAAYEATTFVVDYQD
jgi:hypothetical protein